MKAKLLFGCVVLPIIAGYRVIWQGDALLPIAIICAVSFFLLSTFLYDRE